MKKYYLIILIALLTISCATQNSYRETSSLGSGDPLSPSDKSITLFSSESKFRNTDIKYNNNLERIMVYNAYLTLSTNMNYDSLTYSITQITNEMGGYVMSFDNNGINIRIPSEKLTSTIGLLEQFGEITSKDINSSDISENYYDAKLRLENAEKTLKRYMELLEKAPDVETMLKVEKEIERVNELIEQYKGKLSRMQHIHEFSTIYINYTEKTYPGPVTLVFMGTWYIVKLLFVW